jgi:hypothetical protein
MGSSAAIVEAAYRLFDDDVRRWRDLDLAEWLGLEQPRNIRQTIELNRSELERHGPLHAVRAVADRPQGGGNAASEYWLTFEHAMVICSLSRTSRAEEVRTVMIQVFSKFVHGEIATAPRMELRALEIAADRIVAPILREQRVFHTEVITRMDRQESRLASVEHEIVCVHREVNSRRRNFSKRTIATYIGTVEHKYHGECPCCRSTVIVQNGALLPTANLEHWHGASKARVQDGWLTCARCNARLNETEFRSEKQSAFIEFHYARRVFEGGFPTQIKLDL